MTKFYAQEKQVFDINKVTVVGSPTITSDGVASGFSYSPQAGIRIPLSINATESIVVEISVVYKSDMAACGVYCFNDNTRLSLSNKIVALWTGSSTNTIPSSTYNTSIDIKDGDLLKTKLILTNDTAQIIVSANNTTFETAIKVSTISLDKTLLYIGAGATNGYTPFMSSIDLKSFKIYVDNELVYSPTKPVYSLERRKPKVWNKNNYSVVGSPIITNDGVATSIGGQNYVYIPPIDYTKPFAIKKIGFTRSAWGANYYFINGANTTSDWGGFVIGTNGVTHKLRWFLGSTGTTWDMANGWESTTLLELDKTYYVDLIYSGSDYTCVLYDNNFNEIERQICNKSTAIYNSNKGIMIGSNYIKTTNETFAGSIYLANLTIENDGKEVFTGAKEKFYAMRGM